MPMKHIYLVLCLIGTVWPWVHFGPFFAANGIDFPLFISQMTINPVTKGLTVDICLSILAFWLWSFMDARRQGITLWWLIPLSTICVGLSLALPLYLLLKEGQTGRRT